MKTITKKIDLFNYNELSKEAKEKALSNFRNDNEYDMLTEFLEENLYDLLKNNKITSDNAKVMYSLSYCQGDGAMFYGNFEWKKYNITIKHFGRYYHSNSKTIDISTNDQFFDDASEGDYEKFEKIYQKICHALEKYGYDFIDTENSEQNFIESCESNDWTFLLTGEMYNV